MRIIGREKEKAALKQYYESDSPEFLAVYGRRRVGKTFLIREFFEGKIDFYVTGLAKGSTSKQLSIWNDTIRKSFNDEEFTETTNWLDAFFLLRDKLEKMDKAKRKVIFIDEAPWLDTVKSGFLTALEYFWNGWASGRSDIFLIVCGSATSWVSNNLLKNRGGLYNRVTRRMRVLPFTLSEVEQYLNAKEFNLNRYYICELYMIFGGIPYYLSLLGKGLSIPQNVDALCFDEDGILHNEFNELFTTLFRYSDKYIKVISALSTKAKGLSREEIIKETGFASGGGLTKILNELELCGFIRSYPNFLSYDKLCIYQLIDPFSLFYLRFLHYKQNDPRFWTNNLDDHSILTWKGYAFEQVCLAHSEQIRTALGISGVSVQISSWQSKQSSPGAQIDLIIDRKDGVINLCEIKYYKSEYVISSKEEKVLRNKITAFDREIKTTKATHLTMITTHGVEKNKHSGIVHSEVILDDLFK